MYPKLHKLLSIMTKCPKAKCRSCPPNPHQYCACSFSTHKTSMSEQSTAQFRLVDTPGLSTVIRNHMLHAATRSIAVGSQNIPNNARSPQAPPNKKVRVEIPVNPTNNNPSEAEEDDDFVSQADMCQIDSQQDPVAEDRKHPAYYSNPLYMNSYYSVHDSVSALFAKSLDTVKPSGHLHGQI